MSTLTLRTLRVYRVVGLVLSTIIIGIPFVIPPDDVVVDPFWLRIVLASVVLLVSIGNYFSPFLRRYFLYFVNGYATVLCIWLLWLAFINNLRLDFAPTAIVAILAAGVTFRNSILLWIFTGSLFLLSFFFIPLSTDPVFNPYYFIMVELIGMIGLSVLMSSLIADREKIRMLEKRQRVVTVSAFEYSDTGILVIDLEGNILEVNPRFLELMELTSFKVEAQGSKMPLPSMLDLIKDKESFLALSKEGELSLEKHLYQKFQLKNGRYMERFSKPLLLEGSPIGRIWFYHDVTKQVLERIQAERKRELLEAENAALTELAAATSDPEYNLSTAVKQIAQIGKDWLKVDRAAIWIISEQGDHWQCFLEMSNDSILELPDKTIQSSDLSKFIGLGSASRLLKVTDKTQMHEVGELPVCIPELQNTAFLIVPIRPAGVLRGFILAQENKPAHNWGDEELGFAASLGDIGAMIMESLERRRSENALKKSLAQNRTIVNAVPDLLLRMDQYGLLIDLKIPESFEFQKIVSTPAKDLFELFPDALAEKILENAQLTVVSREIAHFEQELKIEGQTQDFEIRIASSGEMEALVMIRDVTLRKTTERQLIQRNFELDSFVYRASHDLKAPLNSLMGLIEIVREQEQAPNIITYLDLMDRSVVKLDTFIKNLTEFSQINRMQLSKDEVDLKEMVNEIFESLKYMDEGKKITKKVIHPGKTKFIGDRFHLEVVVANLISNALKYHDHQKEAPFVEVEVEFGFQMVEILVRDNGIGIPAEFQDRLFELFFRASNQSFGSGLGLYILRNAVDKLNGTIELESKEGVGSTFKVTIPQ